MPMIRSVAAGTSEATVAADGAGAAGCLSHPPIQSTAQTKSRALGFHPIRVPSCPLVGNPSLIISGDAPISLTRRARMVDLHINASKPRSFYVNAEGMMPNESQNIVARIGSWFKRGRRPINGELIDPDNTL